MAAALTANDDVLRRLLPRLPAGVWSLSGFTVVWFGGIVIPLLAIILVSFLQGRGIRINFDPTFLQYERFFSYGGSDLLARSVRIAATITFIELMIAFPFALWLAKGCRNNMVRLLTFTALTVPFFLSPAARVIVWRSVFGINGVVNQALLGDRRGGRARDLADLLRVRRALRLSRRLLPDDGVADLSLHQPDR